MADEQDDPQRAELANRLNAFKLKYGAAGLAKLRTAIEERQKGAAMARGDGLAPFGPPTEDQAPAEDTSLVGKLPSSMQAVIGGAKAGMLPFGLGDPAVMLNQAGQRMLLARTRLWSDQRSDPDATRGDTAEAMRMQDEMASIRASMRAQQEHPEVAAGSAFVGGAMNPLNRVLPGGAKGGAIGGALDGLGTEFMKGSDAETTLEEAGKRSLVSGVAGGVAGRLSQYASGGARAASNSIRDTKNHTGEIIEALERTAPIRESAEYKAARRGVRGTGDMAVKQGVKIAEAHGREAEAMGRDLAAEEAAIPGNDVPVRIAPAFRRLNKTIERFDTNGRALDPAYEARIREAQRNLSGPVRNDVEYVEKVLPGDAFRRPRRPSDLPPIGEPLVITKRAPSWEDTFGSEFEPPAPPAEPKIQSRSVITPSQPAEPYRGSRAKLQPRYDVDGAAIPEPSAKAIVARTEIPEALADPGRFGERVVPPDEALQPDRFLRLQPGAPGVNKPFATPRNIADQKRIFYEQAGLGAAPDAQNVSARKAGHVLKDTLYDLPDGVGDAYRQIGAKYEGRAKALEEPTALLINKNDARAIWGVDKETGAIRADQMKMAESIGETLRQALSESVAGGKKIERLERLKALGGIYKDAVEHMEARAAEDLTRPAITPDAVTKPLNSGRFFEHNKNVLLVRIVEPVARHLAEVLSRQPAPFTVSGARGASIVAARAIETQKEEERAARIRGRLSPKTNLLDGEAP